MGLPATSAILLSREASLVTPLQRSGFANDDVAYWEAAPAPTFAGLVVAFERARTAEDLAANRWTPLLGVTDRATGVRLPWNMAAIANNATAQFAAYGLVDVVAVRIRVAAIMAGSVRITGWSVGRRAG